MDSVIRVLVAILLLAMALAMPVSARAQQETTAEVGRVIGRAIAAGVVLSSNDFAAAGNYEVDDDAASTFRVSHVGYRRSFEKEGRRSSPFLDVSLGRVVVDQHLDLGGPVRDDSRFDTKGGRVFGGVRIPIHASWFVQAGAALEYSWVESDLTYRSPETEALAPIYDGILFNWRAEALTTIGTAIFGYHREGGEDRLTADAGIQWLGLRTDPVKVDDPVQDVTVSSDYERIYAVFDVPTGASAWKRPLRVVPSIAWTHLGSALADPLDSNDFTEVGCTLAALMRTGGRKFPLERIGFSASYTHADAFDGWSFGVIFSRWFP